MSSTAAPLGGYVQEVLDLSEKVALIASKERLPYPRWISTPDGDLGSEWCSDCGYYKVRNLRRRDRKRREDYILDGGWRTEEENFLNCTACGVALDVSLTDFGVEQVLETYEENGFTTSRTSDAREIGELLSSVEYRFERDDERSEERRQRIVALACRFLASPAPKEQG